MSLLEKVPAAVWQEQHRKGLYVSNPAREGVPAPEGSAVVLFCMRVVADALSRSVRKEGLIAEQERLLAGGRCREQMKTISWAAFCQHWEVKELCIGVVKRMKRPCGQTPS